jgi:hypothetical protein
LSFLKLLCKKLSDLSLNLIFLPLLLFLQLGRDFFHIIFFCILGLEGFLFVSQNLMFPFQKVDGIFSWDLFVFHEQLDMFGLQIKIVSFVLIEHICTWCDLPIQMFDLFLLYPQTVYQSFVEAIHKRQFSLHFLIFFFLLLK